MNESFRIIFVRPQHIMQFAVLVVAFEFTGPKLQGEFCMWAAGPRCQKGLVGWCLFVKSYEEHFRGRKISMPGQRGCLKGG